MTTEKSGPELAVQGNIKSQLDSLEEDRKKIRFQHSISELITGNFRVFESDEFVHGLILTFRKENCPEADALGDILDALMGAVLSGQSSVRERVLPVLYHASNFFLSLNHIKGIHCIYAIMLEWLRFEPETLPGSETIFKRIEECVEWLLKNEKYVEAEEAFEVFQSIQSGAIQKKPVLRGMTGKSLKYFASDENLTAMIAGYQKNDSQQKTYKDILIALGTDAVFFILEKAVETQDRSRRMALINLVVSFGDSAAPALTGCLASKPSWAVVRNIIFIFGEMGNPENYPHIAKYHDYPDERVQLETISSILKLGGDESRGRLTNALGTVNERLKLYILRMLIDKGETDEELYRALKQLAAKRSTFSFSAGTELLSSILTALKMFPSRETVRLLLEMKSDYMRGADVDQVVLLIDEALNFVEPQIRHKSQNKGNLHPTVSFDNDPAQQQMASNTIHSIEVKVQGYLRIGEKKAASAYLYEQAVAATNQRNFVVAEVLRDRLLEVNPFALTEVVKLGELIESQRSCLITSHHIDIWRELYDAMTTAEFNALYYNSTQESYKKGEIIVKSGETDNSLFFLNSGSISLSCDSGGNESFLRRVNPGNILGWEQFFSASVWTVTLKALSSVQVQVLDQQGWQKVLKESPALENTLLSYCQSFERISELVKMSGDDRRTTSRHTVNLPTRHILLDPYGQKGKKSFRGELIDLSRNGIAFTIKLANQKTSKTLLGRQIISYLEMDRAVYPEFSGVVVGVRLFDSYTQSYSVHVKLAKNIDEVQFRKLIAATS